MALSFANASAVPGANAQLLNGAELQEITVESLGFKTLAGETKIKLLPTPWPLNDLPSSTSSLLSISSRLGLLAAAGPNALVLARTKDVRDAFTGPAPEVGENTKDFKPASAIDVPKLSQVAFTSDGAYLVICAEDGGGLQIYETQSLLQDKKDPAGAIATIGISVRALSPNPWPETAHLVAVVLTNGTLLIANLKTKDFMKSVNGSPALKEGVASVSWSNRGKQLTAGMANGHAFQLDHSGAEKASIPAPPGLSSPHHVSSLVWLENNEWLMYHTPNTPDDPDRPPESVLHLVETDKGRTQFQYRKFANDPVAPFGQNRVPLTHYMCRLRNWYKLRDWLMMSSVVSSDVGMITKSDTPLTSDNPITNEFTATSFANDSSRISLPMSYIDQMQDTTAIGMALDLSATEKVSQPIPGDEMDDSPFPLPALMLLSNEGTLSASWVIYNDALRNNQPCPDVIATAALPAPGSSAPTQSPFGGTAVSSPTTSAFGGGFAKPPMPAFGQSTFGTPASATPAFGGASQIGARQSVWGSGNTTKPPGTAFGEPGAIGAAKPVFGSTGALGAAKPVFGSSSAFGASAGGSSPFAVVANGSKDKPAGSPFGALAGNGAKATSPFSAYSGGAAASPFGSMASHQSPFGQQGTTGPSAFAASGTTIGSTPATSFGMSSQPSFGSTVSIDTSTGGGSTIGGKSVFNTPAGTNNLFGKPPSLTPAETQESEMMDDDGEKTSTPKDKPAGPLGLPPGGFKLGTTFKPGNQEDKSDDEGGQEKPRPRGLFGADFGAALKDAKNQTASTPIKTEPTDDKPSLFGIPTAKKDDKPVSSLFGSGASTGAPKPTFTFGKPSPTPVREPAPPEVTSRLEPSPSTATAPSSESKASSKGSKDSDDSHPLAGSEAEAVDMPESSDEETDSESEVIDDAPLPPDPSTVKVSKGFYDQLPIPSAQPKAQMPPDPSTVKVSKDFYSNLPIPGAQPKAQVAPTKALSPPLPQQKPSTESPPFFGGGKTSTTPSGFPKAPQMFAPPMPAVREFPRSPSPVRSASTPMGKPPGTPLSRPPSVRPTFAPSIAPSQPPKPQSHPEQTFKPTDLHDKQAEHNKAILEAPLNPTLHLENFMAHQDYVGTGGKEGIAGQIERLYRDINAMIDTLGLNARSLAEFVSGHNSLMPEKGRSKDDLDVEDGEWCLVEIEDLMGIERSLGEEIESERIEDKDVKIGELYGMRKELVRTKNKLKDVRRFLEQAKDKEQSEKRRNAPLDKATENRQRDIRNETAKFLKVLVEAEEAVSMLKVKLAGSGKATGQVPTVEAVEKTVRKMTQWAEEKGADMDVLESQMKKLGLVSASGKPGNASMRASTSSFRRSGVYSTPSPKKAGKIATPRSNGKGKSFGVPEDDEEESSEDGFESVDADRETIREYVEIRKKKTVVMGRVKDAIRRRGVRVNEG